MQCSTALLISFPVSANVYNNHILVEQRRRLFVCKVPTGCPALCQGLCESVCITPSTGLRCASLIPSIDYVPVSTSQTLSSPQWLPGAAPSLKVIWQRRDNVITPTTSEKNRMALCMGGHGRLSVQHWQGNILPKINHKSPPPPHCVIRSEKDRLPSATPAPRWMSQKGARIVTLSLWGLPNRCLSALKPDHFHSGERESAGSTVMI